MAFDDDVVVSTQCCASASDAKIRAGNAMGTRRMNRFTIMLATGELTTTTLAEMPWATSSRPQRRRVSVDADVNKPAPMMTGTRVSLETRRLAWLSPAAVIRWRCAET